MSGCINSRMLLARVAQYIARSDGEKRRYTDQDALPEYNSSKILSPRAVSYYNLFVNGMLQPPVNYRLTEGVLTFVTQDLPANGASILLEFVTFYNQEGLRVTNDFYVAKSADAQWRYSDRDALPELSTKGIPSPGQVSLQRLFINGVLQPQNLYSVKKGSLALHSDSPPATGTTILLQSIAVASLSDEEQRRVWAVSDAILSIALQQSAVANLLVAQAQASRCELIQKPTPQIRHSLERTEERLVKALIGLEQAEFGVLQQLDRLDAL